MAVRIRLTRVGKKKQPHYRIVAADSRSARDGKFLEVIGTYSPRVNPPAVRVKEDRLKYWIDRGARPTVIVERLVKRLQGKTEVAAPAA